MDVSLILKIAGVGLLVAVTSQILGKYGRDDQAMLVGISGIIVVLLMLIGEVGALFESISDAKADCSTDKKLIYLGLDVFSHISAVSLTRAIKSPVSIRSTSYRRQIRQESSRPSYQHRGALLKRFPLKPYAYYRGLHRWHRSKSQLFFLKLPFQQIQD